jgi:hypothetical protein
VVPVLLLPWCQRRYRDPAFSVVHGVNVQLVTDSVLMPAKGEHGCDSGSESLDNHESRDILHCHVERCGQSLAVADWAE